MCYSQCLIIAGLIFDIIGIIILCFNGLPFDPTILDSYVQITIDPKHLPFLRKQKKFFYFSIVLVIIGFILQLTGTFISIPSVL
jgi:hypothetical protein